MAVVFGKRILSTAAKGLRSLLSFIGALVGILWILAILVLAVVFSVIIAERGREFGIFRALGASRFRLVSLIVSESALISFWGALIGIFLSGLLILPFRIYISRIINMPFVQSSLAVVLCIAAASFLVSFFAGFSASPLCGGYPPQRPHRWKQILQAPTGEGRGERGGPRPSPLNRGKTKAPPRKRALGLGLSQPIFS